jgi:7,8-dihydro-6-hydroxymethylpterin dimethyltransferase
MSKTLSAPDKRAQHLLALEARMRRTGQWSKHQVAGRRWTIGCVSLEITQRCNLDCTLCYLSETSEAVQDLPLEEIFRRIDEIAEAYGPDTDVQISGGDPTLRDPSELSEIVRYIRAKGLRASLFTNGILLTRVWLMSLVADGLNDVAFHVDMTQERKGFASEAALNDLRLKYIEMARGLSLSVIFNTTVFLGNRDDVPMLTRFFIAHSDVVRFASFQLGADTGRGTDKGRNQATNGEQMLNQASVWSTIEKGAGIRLNREALQGGHHQCNKYAMVLALGAQNFDALRDGDFVAKFMGHTTERRFERGQGLSVGEIAAAWSLLMTVVLRPSLWAGGLLYLARLLGWALPQFARGTFHVRKISFFTHNFMDGCALDQERLDACVFMAAGVSGLMSMCAYNAERDRHLLTPIILNDGTHWLPLAAPINANGEVIIPLKWLKGKSRQQALVQREISRHHARRPEDVASHLDLSRRS